MPVITIKQNAKQVTLEGQLFRAGLVILAVGCFAVAFYFGIVLKYFEMPPCIFSTYFRMYCPGCGGTRAVEALFRGHLLESAWYHPIVLYTVFVFGGFMLTQGMERLGFGRVRGWKYHDWYLYGAVIVLVCNFLIKNLLRWVWGITI